MNNYLFLPIRVWVFFFIGMVVGSIILLVLELASVFIFLSMLNLILGSNIDVPEFFKDQSFDVPELAIAYFAVFVLAGTLNYVLNLSCFIMGDRVFKHLLLRIFESRLSVFESRSLQHYQVALFEEIRKFTERLLYPLVIVVSRAIVIATVTLGYFLYDPRIVVFFDGGIILIFAGVIAFGAVYYIVKRFSSKIIKLFELVFKSVSDSLSRWRSVQITRSAQMIVEENFNRRKTISNYYAITGTLQAQSRYILDLLIILGLVFAGDASDQSGVGSEVFLVAGLIGYRLLPHITAFLTNVTVISSGLPSFSHLREIEKNYLNLGYESIVNNAHYYTGGVAKIEVRNLSFEFDRRPIFTGLSTSFPSRGIVVIRGESGSGKSTFLDVLLGFRSPSEGEISVITDGSDSLPIMPWNLVGLVEQSFDYLSISVRDFLGAEVLHSELNEYFLYIFPSMSASDIDIFMSKKLNHCSGGEKQRIAFLKAICSGREVVVFDEVGSGLDRVALTRCIQLVKRLSREKLFIWVTHIDAVATASDLVVHLQREGT